MRSLHQLGALGLAALAAVVLWGGTASAQDGTPADPDAYVGGNTSIAPTPAELTPEAPDASVSGESLSSAGAAPASQEVKSATLAFTGGDIVTLSVIGLGAVLVGAIVVFGRRRNTNPAQ
jgi:hypothetical protein